MPLVFVAVPEILEALSRLEIATVGGVEYVNGPDLSAMVAALTGDRPMQVALRSRADQPFDVPTGAPAIRQEWDADPEHELTLEERVARDTALAELEAEEARERSRIAQQRLDGGAVGAIVVEPPAPEVPGANEMNWKRRPPANHNEYRPPSGTPDP